jgi:hypothetical protein
MTLLISRFPLDDFAVFQFFLLKSSFHLELATEFKRSQSSQICSINSVIHFPSSILSYITSWFPSKRHSIRCSINWQTICQMILKLMSFVFPTFNVKSRHVSFSETKKEAKTMLLVT